MLLASQQGLDGSLELTYLRGLRRASAFGGAHRSPIGILGRSQERLLAIARARKFRSLLRTVEGWLPSVPSKRSKVPGLHQDLHRIELWRRQRVERQVERVGSVQVWPRSLRVEEELQVGRSLSGEFLDVGVGDQAQSAWDHSRGKERGARNWKVPLPKRSSDRVEGPRGEAQHSL